MGLHKKEGQVGTVGCTCTQQQADASLAAQVQMQPCNGTGAQERLLCLLLSTTLASGWKEEHLRVWTHMCPSQKGFTPSTTMRRRRRRGTLDGPVDTGYHWPVEKGQPGQGQEGDEGGEQD